MSETHPWPYPFIKQWILPISYMVGFTYEGYAVSPAGQYFSFDPRGGVITATALFNYPVVAVYGFSQRAGYYTDPLVVVTDYPVLGVFLRITIMP
jgi:hypothetical protein